MVERLGPPGPNPSASDAAGVVEAVTGARVVETARFPTGLAHYVYEVRTDDGRVIVARLTRLDLKRLYDGSRYWDRLLRPRGVPLPAVLFADDGARFGFPVVVIERLPGRDLGEVYGDLSADQKGALARWIVAIQAAVSELPRASGFGYALSHADPELRPRWTDVLADHMARCRTRLAASDLVDSSLVDRVAGLIGGHDAYFARVEPIAFLDDLTTKNVIVDGGTLSGVVDVDMVCFSDQLRTPALTYVALTSLGYETDYVAYWLGELCLSAGQRTAFEIYVAMDCVGLLSEQGQRFNQDRTITFDKPRADRMLSLLHR